MCLLASHSLPPPLPSRAVELLQRYYEGQLASLDEDDTQQQRQQQQHKRHKAGVAAAAAAAGSASQLLTEEVKPRAGMPPLLVNLSERPPEPLHYLGVSYGLTQQLYGFWRRAGFQPVYLRQSASDVTGEHTVVMLRPLEAPGLEVQVRGARACLC
jgi:N-acetyltransferase 10